MDRRSACIAKASACREKAQSEPDRRDYWIDESIKWLELAMQPTGRVSMSYEATDGSLVPKVDRAKS
jgi:hypothetical protein